MTDVGSLNSDQVRRIAHLARLQLDDDALARSSHELSKIIRYVEMLQRLDVSNVEPMTHPSHGGLHVNRLAADDVQPPLPTAELARIAPQMEGLHVAVPKVLPDDAGGSAGGA